MGDRETMIVRAYKSSDCGSLASLFYDTVHTVNAADYSDAQLDAWATGTVDLVAWNRSFVEHDTLVAVLDGQIVGFADMDATGYLDRLYIHKDYQRKGIASALVQALEQRAYKAGIVSYSTYASITAKAFFEKQGYVVEHENQVLRNGVSLVNYKMVKP